MDFRILGPLEVWDRGRPIELRRRKERALLAILLLRAGTPVSADELIDGLWGERPPRTAKAALQNNVAQLRRALGPGVLRSDVGGYVLDIAPEQVDLGRFERLVSSGREHEGRERVERLREALSLWRGEPLADLAYEPFAAHEAGRLAELRTAVLEDLIDAKLALGAGAELVEELESLVEAHPFRERMCGQLMLALYRDGRQADALAVYQATRKTLVDELGIEPSAPLRELERAILRQDPSLAPAPGRHATPREERRTTVTVLLAEIACPTALDPEPMRRASVAALNAMKHVLERHEATIEQRGDDELMAVFGVPRAREDDTLRAAHAALALRAALATASGEVLGLRIAIESGEVLTGTDEGNRSFVTGPGITHAKRLLQQAESAEILVGSRASRFLAHAGVLEPRGAERESGLRLVQLAESPPALVRRLEAPLIGRRMELAELRQAVGRVADTRSCRIALLLGEPGIGKTRLASELTRELADEATVLVGRCVSYGIGATYLPLAEIIREAVHRVDLDRLLHEDAHGELIRARLDELTGHAEGAAAGGETFWAVARLVEELARERPVLLVFEDLHWAEPTLLDLMDYLARRVADAPLLLLGVARPELLELRPRWQELEATTLAPLSPKDCEALITSLGDVTEKVRSRVLSTAGGNPLFIEQLVAYADEDGDTETPPSLEALLESRLDRLEPEELAALQRAAVIGREFARNAVAHLVAEDDAGPVDDHLQALARKGFVRAGRPLRFHHVLVRDAAYATLPKGRRAALHARLARWLASRPEASDELVGFHLEQAHSYLAELGQPDERLAVEAGQTLGAAGIRAWRRADVAAAVNLIGRAVALLPRDEPGRLELLCELGLALRTAGEIERADEVLREAVETAARSGERRIELRARLEQANVRLSSRPEGSAAGLLALAEDAIPTFEALGDDRSLGRAWLLAGYVRGGLYCWNADWGEAAEHALVHYRRSGWPTAACFGELATSLFYGSTPVPDAIRRCRQLLAEVSERGGEAHVLVWLGGLEAFAGRIDRGLELLDEASTIYDELGYGLALAYGCNVVRGEIELLADRPAQAEEALRASCTALREMREGALLASRASELAEAIYRQGRYEESESWVTIAADHAATDDVGAQFLRRAVGAKLLARRASFVEAERLAREAVALTEPTDALNSRAKVLLDLAEVLRLGGLHDEAVAPTELALEQFARKGNCVGAEHARRVLGAAQAASQSLR